MDDRGGQGEAASRTLGGGMGRAAKLVPPREVTLESAIEFIADDELVEITPAAIRIRKRALTESERRRAKKK